MNGRFNLKAEFSNMNSTILTELTLISFQENHVFFVYCPALDLTGYGENEVEARNSFSQTLKMYVNYTVQKKTLFKDLEEHGWTVQRNKKLKAPDFDFLFQNNKEFKSIVNNKDFSKYKEKIQLPESVHA